MILHEGIRRIEEQMAAAGYIADREVATAIFLSIELQKPLLIEGPAGVGKTDIARVLTGVLGTNLIRLQCYEGLDASSVLYEWNYPKQILWTRLLESEQTPVREKARTIFSQEFLIEGPLLRAITQEEQAAVLLIDEVDRGDEELESFLLEVLDDFQVTIPEVGTIRAKQRPHVILTSNRTRELSDALRRRCMYLWIPYPSLEKELRIVLRKLPGIERELAEQICRCIQVIRGFDLAKVPGIVETLDWGRALQALHLQQLDVETIETTLGAFIKDASDLQLVREFGVEALYEKAFVNTVSRHGRESAS